MTNTKKPLGAARGKVFVGLSGGVDSSVAAHLLKEQDYDVVGVHLRCWNRDGCDEKEAEDARRVAEHLDIPYYVFDLEKEYKEKVVDYMIDGYRRGITPNPDVACNREIKFGLFLEKALGSGADYIATGHYVRLLRNDESRNSNAETNSKLENRKSKFSLWTAKDLNKDQSYFLWTLGQEELAHALFPLGELTKAEVRRIAKEAGLPTADKKDSQGICFIGTVTLKEFLGEYLPKERGNAKTPDGTQLGTHDGAHFFTIGQRHGLGIGGSDKPFFVAEKNVATNTVVLAPEDDPLLYQNEATLTDVNFIPPLTPLTPLTPFSSPSTPATPIGLIRANYAGNVENKNKNNRIEDGGSEDSRIEDSGKDKESKDSKKDNENESEKRDSGIQVFVRIRYRQPLVSARIMNQESGMEGGSIVRNSKFLILKFDEPIKFMSPGQSAVFYNENGQMLGGGVIGSNDA